MLAFDTDIYAVLRAISVINTEMEKLKKTNSLPHNVLESHETLACSLVEYAHTILEFLLPIVGKKSVSDISIDRMLDEIEKAWEG